MQVEMPTSIAIGILCIAVAGVAAQWLAWRLRLPAIVLLFAIGLVVGPGLQILHPAQMFGDAMRPLVGLAVAIVVFEGGLALNIRELRAVGEGVLRLTALALPLSFVLSSTAAHFLAGLRWGSAALFGAITVVTGPTVVLPLLRHTRLERRTASFLKWEAIVNDPLGALLAAIVLSMLLARGEGHGGLALELVAGLLVSIGLGVGSGWFVRWLFVRDQAPEVLKIPILLALALGLYAVTNLVMDEAGLAAATIFGITLANLRIPGLTDLARFKEALVVMLVSALFVVLTASLERSLLTQLSWRILLLTGAMLFVVRPAAIWLATLGSGLNWRERALAGWIAPRGIVAASVAGVASTQLAGASYHGAEPVMPAVFALIAATMVLHGFSLAPLARLLRLTLGNTPVLAIVGASAWTVDLAETLLRGGAGILLIDTFPGALDKARQRGLPVLQAELLSEHGGHNLSGRRVDYLFAATPDDIYNSLVCTHLAPELGRHRVFQLRPSGSEFDDWVGLSRERRGEVLGTPALTFKMFRRRHKQGWCFSIVEPSEAGNKGGSLLMAIRRNGSLLFASSEAAEIGNNDSDRLLIFTRPTSRRNRTLAGRGRISPRDAPEPQERADNPHGPDRADRNASDLAACRT
jgi:NhaP-type Na+/H+ or K+/H+ antiporter